jgi:hypothetical protein
MQNESQYIESDSNKAKIIQNNFRWFMNEILFSDKLVICSQNLLLLLDTL